MSQTVVLGWQSTEITQGNHTLEAISFTWGDKGNACSGTSKSTTESFLISQYFWLLLDCKAIICLPRL
jgi:hypothetical protein